MATLGPVLSLHEYSSDFLKKEFQFQRSLGRLVKYKATDEFWNFINANVFVSLAQTYILSITSSNSKIEVMWASFQSGLWMVLHSYCY